MIITVVENIEEYAHSLVKEAHLILKIYTTDNLSSVVAQLVE